MLQSSIPAHELGHTQGFWHEQSRPDRDTYVTVLMGNVLTESESDFDLKDEDDVNTFGIPYDHGSVMHSGPKVIIE